MLEKYEENFNRESFLKGLMNKRGVNRTQALQICKKEIPHESYFQDKIKKALKKRYRGAFIRKITQGRYSEGGTPDLMCIINGHYFGFEIKRPILGEPSRLQEVAIREIQAAGGTAAYVTWPEECYKIIDEWKGKGL
jgi:hypothetical protein